MEPEERRAKTKGNAARQSVRRAQNWGSLSQALDRIRQVASQRTKEKLIALLDHVSLEYLEAAFFQLKENAAPGELTWQAYEADLDRNIADLHARLHRRSVSSPPSRRVYTKPDGRQHPRAVAALEDKIVQRRSPES